MNVEEYTIGHEGRRKHDSTFNPAPAFLRGDLDIAGLGGRSVGAGLEVFPSSCRRRNSSAPIREECSVRNDMKERGSETHIPPFLTFRGRETFEIRYAPIRLVVWGARVGLKRLARR